MTNLIGSLGLGPSIAIIAGAVAILVVAVTIIAVCVKRRRTSKRAAPEDLEAKIQSNGTQPMAQKHSIMASISSSQIDLSKPSKHGDIIQTGPVNEPIRSKRIAPPERLQAFDPMTYGLRRNSISSMNSTTGLSPSHLPYPPSMRSATPDSMSSKRWVDPHDVHFNRPSTPATKPWVSPLDIHFSRPTTPLASRPTTPASVLPSRRLSLGSNLPSTADKNDDITDPTEDATTFATMSDAKLSTGPKNSGDAREDISGLESEMFPLPPTMTSQASNKLQASELEQHDFTLRETSHSRNHSSSGINDATAPVLNDWFEQPFHVGHADVGELVLDKKRDASSVNIYTQAVDPSSDLSSQHFKERAFSIAASSRYSTNDYTFSAARGSGEGEYRSDSRSLDSQSRQQAHIHRQLSSARGASPSLDLLNEDESGSDRERSRGDMRNSFREHRLDGQLDQNPNDTAYDNNLDIEIRESHFSVASFVQEDVIATPADSNHHHSESLTRTHLAVPNSLEIGTAIPFGVGLHKRGASEASENSIGDFYDAYYRLSTMGLTNEQDTSVISQHLKQRDWESTVDTEQQWNLDPEENQLGQYPPFQNEQPQHDTEAGEFWKPKPQKLYFQSPNQQRPHNTQIPKQLQPQHLQQQQDFHYDRDLPLPHRPHRKGTPAPPSFHSPDASYDNTNLSRGEQRYSPPLRLDIGRTAVEMQSPLASPTFGSQGQSIYPSRAI